MRFGATVAVRNLSLEVRDGELLVLVGPSGCGKTTVLRIVAGLERQTSGDVVIGERVVSDTPPKDRDVAMAFQNFALYPHMTARDNLAFGLKLRGLSPDEVARRVDDVAGSLGIAHLLARTAAELSAGERQRVALGRTIVRESAVMLLDEPLSNLDPDLRARTRRIFRDHQARARRTAIYVTHDREEAMALADRIAVMSEGTLQQVGTPEALRRQPASSLVAGYVGAAA